MIEGFPFNCRPQTLASSLRFGVRQIEVYFLAMYHGTLSGKQDRSCTEVSIEVAVVAPDLLHLTQPLRNLFAYTIKKIQEIFWMIARVAALKAVMTIWTCFCWMLFAVSPSHKGLAHA